MERQSDESRHDKKALSSQRGIIVRILLIGLWGAQLLNTDAYYVNYAMLLVITGICFFQCIFRVN